ncbi:hypothetical protein VTO42DRAFT_8910 [Malbranchea cinnamomea]
MASADHLSNSIRAPSDGHSLSSKSKYDRRLVRAKSNRLATHPGIPPSVAALLEATTIPLPRKSRQSRTIRNSLPRRSSSVGHKLDDCASARLSTLFSGLDEAGNKRSVPYDGKCDSQTSVTSSLPGSLPSLESDDDRSTTTTFSDPPTPASNSARVPFEKKQKVVSQAEPCDSDPLLLSEDFPFPEEPGLSNAESMAFVEEANRCASSRPFPKLKATFKSNFSSSLRALKVAALSVSNFTSPSIWVHHSHGQSILSIAPELTDDKRPKITNKIPSATLRRYLNPNSAYVSSIHSYYESSRGRHEPVVCTSSIQMQTYSNSSSHENCGSRSSDWDPLNPAPRHREVRENSDFLRMFVLELNMRRMGKLHPNQPGRAQVWLPPRMGDPLISRSCSLEMPGLVSATTSTGSNIPQRWVSLTVD